MLSAEFSAVLKGLAILLMLFHHCCGFPGWIIVSGIQFSESTIIMGHNAKICVSIYAFLTAYAFYLHKDKSNFYIFRKIISFLISYWMVLCFVSLIAYTLNGNDCLGQIFIESLFPVHNFRLMSFAWYVVFYTLLMIVLPYINLGEKRNGALFQTCYPIVLCALFSLLFKSLDIVGGGFFVSVLLGHLCAKFNILNKIALCLHQKGTTVRFVSGGVFLFLFCIGFVNPNFKEAVGPFWQILIFPLILSFLLLCSFFRKIHLTSMLIYLGKHSLNIWFLHCIFFSSLTKSFFQPIIYWSGNPILTVLTALLLCLLPSLLLKRVQDCISNIIKRVLLKPMAIPSENTLNLRCDYK